MHIHETVKILREANSLLSKYKSTYNSGQSDTPNSVENLLEVREGIKIISDIDFLNPLLQKLKDNELFKTTNDVDRFSYTDDSNIKEFIGLIKNVTLGFTAYYLENFKYSEEDMKIRLPDFNDFEELSRISNDLKIAIDVPVNSSNTGGSVKILSAEPGSVWLVIGLSTVMAVKLIGAICWSAAVIRKKKAEAKMFEAHSKTLDLKNEMIDMLVKAQKEQLKNIATAEAEAIANKFYDVKDPESIKRLTLAMNTVADLIDRGAKFIPESKDKDVKSQFPDYSNLNFIESTIRQITENN